MERSGTGVPDPPSRNADPWRSSLCACESQYPAEIHDQIQSENVGIKSLGILDTFRRNVRYDAFYRHGPPTLRSGKTRT